MCTSSIGTESTQCELVHRCFRERAINSGTEAFGARRKADVPQNSLGTAVWELLQEWEQQRWNTSSKPVALWVVDSLAVSPRRK